MAMADYSIPGETGAAAEAVGRMDRRRVTPSANPPRKPWQIRAVSTSLPHILSGALRALAVTGPA
jgi:hypothetical protein